MRRTRQYNRILNIASTSEHVHIDGTMSNLNIMSDFEIQPFFHAMHLQTSSVVGIRRPSHPRPLKKQKHK